MTVPRPELSETPGVTDWTVFYDATGDEPWATLRDALDRFEQPGLAVDLGSGTGRDTAELVRRGWRVIAIDAEPEAMIRLAARTDLDHSQVTTQIARFEDAKWPDVDLVNSSFSLPFVPADDFGAVWGRIVDSLRPGGRFSGQLFGDHDTWASQGVTCFTRSDVEALLSGLYVERLDEEEEDSQDAGGTPKHWHLFHIVARKTPQSSPSQ
jgi:trans-aconitate methyltransferase